MMTSNETFSRASRVLAVGAVLLMAGCVEAPPRRVYEPPPPDRPNTDLYAYPMNNQTRDQQERDRYECNAWAVKQTGFDPSGPNVPPHDRYRVVSAGPPPGEGTALGALTGAILGAAVSGPGDTGAGLLFGAVAGGLVGTAAEQQQREAAAQQAQQMASARSAQDMAVIDQHASNYRRALGACLEGRGYSVK